MPGRTSLISPVFAKESLLLKCPAELAMPQMALAWWFGITKQRMVPEQMRCNGTFASPALAKAQLHRWLNLPHSPADVETRVDSLGKVIGERIAASFTIAEGKEVSA
jgi:hypothetical protein